MSNETGSSLKNLSLSISQLVLGITLFILSGCIVALLLIYDKALKDEQVDAARAMSQQLAMHCQPDNSNSLVLESDLNQLKEARRSFENLEEIVSRPPILYSASFADFKGEVASLSWCGNYIGSLVESREFYDTHKDTWNALTNFIDREIAQEVEITEDQPIATTIP